jgi:nitric oxide dioxygenase
MLSAASRPYIEASVPVLREHGLAIARTFYRRLFEAHPELKNLFNLGNQASGAQQSALSAAVFAYAANVDQPEVLGKVIDRIAHKHASVGIKPAHYPIVARHLLAAIQEVLGAAATPELLAAWDEAYWLLAGELIALEARLYERAAATAGAFRSLLVTRVERESPRVLSFYLQADAAAGLRSPGRFEPGQYVSVAVELKQHGVRQLRQYSLSDAPSRPYWRITVKSETGAPSTPEGMVSNHLHAHVTPGDRLLVSAPFGEFTPLRAAEKPLALLSAGVGITPLASALNALAESRSERAVLFAHAARDGSQQLFARELAHARARMPQLRSLVFHETRAAAAGDARPGRMQLTPELLHSFGDADFYLCGPQAFMQQQWRDLIALGVPADRIEREVFGPEMFDRLVD